jgi:peptidoglycan hydrolase-like protein with peptidoglycan-binding domain
MTSFTPFADATNNSLASIPASRTMVLIALYATGTNGIEATAVNIMKYKAAGTGVVLIDQTASLSVFAAGLADVADVERGAGTYASCAAAILARQKHGWQSTVYIAQSNLDALVSELHAVGCDMSLVLFGIANWSDSQAAAEAALDADASWAYIQYGDPGSNPDTLVPGTSVTLRSCNADINVGKDSWADGFMPHEPKPKPAAEPELKLGDTGAAVKLLQGLLNGRPVHPGLTVDGIFGPDTLATVRLVQVNNHLTVDGIVGPQTWAVLGNYS